MSYQAYLDNIKKKTGKSADDFRRLADKKGLLRPDVKAGQVIAWLKADFGLGHGHAMAMYGMLKSVAVPRPSLGEQIEKHFSASRAVWHKPFDRLIAKVRRFGPDVSVDPTKSYISLLRAGRKFAIVQVTADRLDVGLKLKGVVAGDRLTAAGKWNAMVTHRVRVESPKRLDAELFGWLRNAYDRA